MRRWPVVFILALSIGAIVPAQAQTPKNSTLGLLATYSERLSTQEVSDGIWLSPLHRLGPGVYEVLSRSIRVEAGDVLIAQSIVSVSSDYQADRSYPYYAHLTCDGVRTSPQKSKPVNNYSNHHGPVVIGTVCSADRPGALTIALVVDLRGPVMTVQGSWVGGTKLDIEHYRADADSGVRELSSISGLGADYEFGFDSGYVYYDHLGLDLDELDESSTIYLNGMATAQYDPNTSSNLSPSQKIDMFGFQLRAYGHEDPTYATSVPMEDGGWSFNDSAENLDGDLYRFSQSLFAHVPMAGQNTTSVGFKTKIYGADPNTGMINNTSQSVLQALTFSESARGGRHRLDRSQYLPIRSNMRVSPARTQLLTSTSVDSSGESYVRASSHLQAYASSAPVGSAKCDLWSEVRDRLGNLVQRSPYATRYLGKHRALPLVNEFIFKLPSTGRYSVRTLSYCSGSASSQLTIYASGSGHQVDHFN